jgi:anti-sigma regulatory factor (Ser/Thr protein kinase)
MTVNTPSMMFCQTILEVREVSQVGEARREAQRIAVAAGLTTPEAGKVAIIATEMATNLSQYASSGEILLRSFDFQGCAGVELLAIDRGPGMSDVAKCIEDGYSTGGSTGTGLGAMQRLATEFDLHSQKPQGTVVFARVQSRLKSQPGSFRFEWGVINCPARGENVCGDTWRIACHRGRLTVLIADGLGHGPQAAAAAAEAAHVFEEAQFTSITDYLSCAHGRMANTRGAALAVAQIDGMSGILSYSGVGNIAGSLRSRREESSRGLVSHHGIVGAQLRKVQQFDYECPVEPVLILHSDGMQSRWSLDSYPGLIQRHPAVVAGVLYRDFSRGHDDITVCVVRFLTSPAG